MVTAEDGIYTTREFQFQPRSFNAPLIVSTPTSETVIHRGDWIDASIEPTERPIDPRLDYALICNDTNIYGANPDHRLALGSATHSNGRFRFQVPNTFLNCEAATLHVSATVSGYDCSPNCPKLRGGSAPFRSEVYAISQGYTVTNPMYGDTFHRGGVIPVRVTYGNDTEISKPLGVYLLQSVGGISMTYSATPGGTFELPIPDDLRLETPGSASELFQIIVFDLESPNDRNRSGWSDRFRIIP